MWSRCRELGVAAITYAPLARVDLSKHAQFEPSHLWAKLTSSQHSSLRHVAYEMEAGDLIYVKDGPRIVCRGKVSRPYTFDGKFRIHSPHGNPWAHQVLVEWETGFKPLDIKLGAEPNAVLPLTGDRLRKLEQAIVSSGQSFSHGVGLVPVDSALQVRSNVSRFNRDCSAFLEPARKLVRRAEHWVWDPDDNAFAPAKFAGFNSMTFTTYGARQAAYKGSGGFDADAARRAVSRVLGGRYRPDELLADLLAVWADANIAPGAVAHVNRSKWKFARLPQQRNYWAACVRPGVFDVDRALNKLRTDTWAVKKSDVREGDLLVLWRGSKHGKRGVVGLAEVISDPEMMRSGEEGRQFWIDESLDTVERRVWVRLYRPPNTPLWLEDDETGLLGSLTVAKAHGGTIFKVTPEQWHRLVELLGGWEGSTEPQAEEAIRQVADVVHRGRGQGFKISAEARKAIDAHAMREATEYFKADGYDVEDVSKNHPFDLRCTKGSEELRVEVKGTTTAGEAVLLTPNEVAHAREKVDKMVLFILHSVEVNESEDRVRASGGTVAIKRPWEIDGDGSLVAVGYSYELG